MIIAYTAVVLLCGFMIYERIAQKKYAFAFLIALFIGIMASFVQIGFSYVYSHSGHRYSSYYNRY